MIAGSLWLTLTLTLALAPVPAVEPSAWDAGDRLSAQGEHAAAAEAYARAWAQEHEPAILYSWAQAARLAGDCATAAGLYARFAEQGAEPPASFQGEMLAEWSKMHANAERQRAACEQAQRDAPSPEPAPVVTPAEHPPPLDIGPRPVAQDDRPPTKAPPRARPDPIGWALLGAGGAVAVTGAVLVGLAARRDAQAGEAGTHERFRDDITAARTEQTIGLIALGVGAGLVVGGASRLLVLRRRDTRATARVVPLGLGARF